MPPNTTIFLLGLAVGTGLLVFGMMLGYWTGRKSAAPPIDQSQFLAFVRNLSLWTSEFAGDVSKYQNQIDSISRQARGKSEPPKEEVLGLLSQIMSANQQLQQRLDDTEKRLETQTVQISSYLTEARTDGLTGLQNRRAFDKATDELFAAWTSKQKRFALGLIDIDHFKQINDTYGHPAGDAVLKQVAQLIQSELRESICVARYGGEEFGILQLASGDDLAGAFEGLRQRLAVLEIMHDGQRIAVTLSGGVSQILPDEKIGKLVRRADEALYAAKLAGRNRVFLHNGRACVQVTLASLVRSETAIDNPQNNSPELKEPELKEPELKELEGKVQQRLQRLVAEESRRNADLAKSR